MSTPVLITLTVLFVVSLIVTVIFFKQLKGILVLFANTAIGWLGLYIYNLLIPAFTIGINIASASVAGVLGLPGLILLITLKSIYK